VQRRMTIPYSVLELARSSLLVVFGLVIAFTPNHSARFGLLAFGIFVVAASVVGAWLAGAVSATPQAKSLHGWQAIVGIVVGGLAVALNQAGVVFLLWAVVLWAVLTGAAEWVAGWRMARTHTLRRDWMVQGVMTLLLAIVVLAQPADSVAVIGFLGAWAMIQGVYGIIAGLSDRWAHSDTTAEARG